MSSLQEDGRVLWYTEQSLLLPTVMTRKLDVVCVLQGEQGRHLSLFLLVIFMEVS